MDVLEALRARRSIGKLGGDVAPEAIRALIEAAVWAPNHRLTEPWRFTVLRGAARQRLGHAWAEIVARETSLTGDERTALLQREAAKPLRAPVLVVVSTRTDPDPIVATEDFAATAAAIENMLLAATATGVGAMWRTGGFAYSTEIVRHLGLDPSDRIVGIVYLGEPAIEPPRGRPREVEGVIRWLE